DHSVKIIESCMDRGEPVTKGGEPTGRHLKGCRVAVNTEHPQRVELREQVRGVASEPQSPVHDDRLTALIDGRFHDGAEEFEGAFEEHRDVAGTCGVAVGIGLCCHLASSRPDMVCAPVVVEPPGPRPVPTWRWGSTSG